MGLFGLLKEKGNAKGKSDLQAEMPPVETHTPPGDASDTKRDVIEVYKEWAEKQAHFRKLTIQEQLEELQKEALTDNKIIGEIYIQDPPDFNDRDRLSSMLGDAKLIETFGIAGQGDNEINLMFARNNLLIGVKYFAYWRAPLTAVKECKVYRFPKGTPIKKLNLDRIKNMLFF